MDRDILHYSIPLPDDPKDAFTITWFYRSLRPSELDVVDRFISLWICFNSIIRKEYGEQLNDTRLIEKVTLNSYWNKLFDDNKSGFQFEIDAIKKEGPVKNEKNGVLIQINSDTFKETIKMIYQVRCNLFHGRKDPEIEARDYNLISNSYGIMLILIMRHLENVNPRYLTAYGELIDWVVQESGDVRNWNP